VPSSDSGDDFVWVGGPGEGFGIIVGLDDEAVDGDLEVDDTSKDTALESGLSAIDRLDLRLFVDREDDGMGGRIDIKPDHVALLVDELRIVGELELLDPVRLEAMRAPDALDGTRADLGPPDMLMCGVAIPRERCQTAAVTGLESDANTGSHVPDSHATNPVGIPPRIQMLDLIH
jgi:hypothetical protein